MCDRIVVGITGASGVIYGIRLLQMLHNSPGIETHLILSAAAEQTIVAETNWTVPEVKALAQVVYDVRQIGEAIASGSFATRGMVVIPCSVKTLSAIAHSYADNLIVRAADVTLKEGRPLILVVRETPLHLGHLRLMERAAEIGAVIFPPMPAWYGRPQTLDAVIDSTVGRVLARLGVDNQLFTRWNGIHPTTAETTAPIVTTDARTQLATFLAAQTTLTLATVNANGLPQACDVLYAQPEDQTSFYFLSDPKTAHAQNIQRTSCISATVHDAAHEWEKIRGVQIVGDAERIADRTARQYAFDCYIARYPFVQQWLSSVDALGRETPNVGVVELYQITPHWVRWIDNSQGFGYKEEFPALRSV